MKNILSFLFLLISSFSAIAQCEITYSFSCSPATVSTYTIEVKIDGVLQGTFTEGSALNSQISGATLTSVLPPVLSIDTTLITAGSTLQECLVASDVGCSDTQSAPVCTEWTNTPQPISCSTQTPADCSTTCDCVGNAAGGSGQFVDDIFWFDFGQFASLSGSGGTHTYTLPCGDQITVTLDNLQTGGITTNVQAGFGALNHLAPNDYDFAAGHQVIVNSAAQLVADVSVQGITASGCEYTPNIIFADAENSTSAETHTYTSTGTFSQIDHSGNGNSTVTGLGTGEVVVSNTVSNGAPIIMLSGSCVGTFDIIGNSRMAIGILMPCSN